MFTLPKKWCKVSQEMFTKSLELYSVLRNFARVEDILTCLQQGNLSSSQGDNSLDPATRYARRSREERIWQDPVARGAESGQIRWVPRAGSPHYSPNNTMSLNRSDAEGLVMWDVIIGLSIHLI